MPLSAVCTESNNGTVSGNNGGADAWLVKLSANGTLLWQKCAGTANDEIGFAGICLAENSFVVAGFGKAPGYTDFDGYLVRLGYRNTINGILFRDDNGNGIKDANEALYNQQAIVKVKKGNTEVATNYISDGKFTIGVDTGSFTTSIQADYLYYQIVPAAITSNFQTYFNSDSLYFALQPLSGKKDLFINLVPLGSVRPGFSTSYRVVYKNLGTTTIPAGEVWFKKDSRTTLLSSSVTPSSVSGDTLKWSYTNFKPADSTYIFLRLQVAAPPAANIYDTLSCLAVINPVSGDETPANNTAILRQVVKGSLDPNDKVESHGGSVPASFIANGSYLQYTIRFQNTGNDVAYNIAVKDTLSNRLDAGTFQMVDASHSYSLFAGDGNKLTWAFNNINLPDNKTNDSASNGYIVYRIRPKNDVVAGETIHNTASLYFDYNLPERTNDAPTVIASNFAVLPQLLLNFSGSQQAGKIALHWKVADAVGLQHFEIERSTDGSRFASIGSRKAEGGTSDYAFTDSFPVLSSPSSLYRLKLIDREGGLRYSSMLAFRNGSNTENVIEIYPNPMVNQAFIALKSNRNCIAELQLLNVAGTTLSKETISVLQGKNVYPLRPAKNMLSGTYFVRIIINREAKSAAFIIQ